MFDSTRPEMGECIMGTEGTIEITVGNGESTAIVRWIQHFFA